MGGFTASPEQVSLRYGGHSLTIMECLDPFPISPSSPHLSVSPLPTKQSPCLPGGERGKQRLAACRVRSCDRSGRCQHRGGAHAGELGRELCSPQGPSGPHFFLPHQHKEKKRKVMITVKAYVTPESCSEQAATVVQRTLNTNDTKPGGNQVALSSTKKWHLLFLSCFVVGEQCGSTPRPESPAQKKTLLLLEGPNLRVPRSFLLPEGLP